MSNLQTLVEDTIKLLKSKQSLPDFSERMSLIQAIEHSWAAVQEKGEDYEYVNPHGQKADGKIDCYNWDRTKNQPSCIVGNVLHRSGVSPRVLMDHDKESPWSFGEYLSDKAIEFLANVQSHQDDGTPWGKALEFALGDVSIQGA